MIKGLTELAANPGNRSLVAGLIFVWALAGAVHCPERMCERMDAAIEASAILFGARMLRGAVGGGNDGRNREDSERGG